MHSCLYRYTSLSNTNNTQNVLIVEIRLKRNPLENTFKLIQNYLLPIEFIHMSLCLDHESLQFHIFIGSAFLALPKPLDVSGREQLQLDPGLLGVGFGVDDDPFVRDVEVERLIFAKEVILLKASLELAFRVVHH